MDLGIYFAFDYQLHMDSFHDVTSIVLSIRASGSNSHTRSASRDWMVCLAVQALVYSIYEKLTLDRS